MQTIAFFAIEKEVVQYMQMYYEKHGKYVVDLLISN